MAYRYDEIGTTYGRYRRPDPRIMDQIQRALGDATSVVDIGAGTGNYSPAGRRVIAVEPSEGMIAQRPGYAAPVIRAVAGALPFPSGSFDAALATLTVHHWNDPAAGLAEMRRVASRQVIFTFEQNDDWVQAFWLTRDYLPQEHFRGPTFCGLAPVRRQLSVSRVEVVPVPADCTDGFLCAYWRRPGAYLDPGVRTAISVLALMDARILEPGLLRLEQDIRSGAWAARNRALLDLEACDWGYRLVICESDPTHL